MRKPLRKLYLLAGLVLFVAGCPEINDLFKECSDNPEKCAEVLRPNRAPIGRIANLDSLYKPGDTIFLDARLSSDSDASDTLKFSWRVFGNATVLSPADSAETRLLAIAPGMAGLVLHAYDGRDSGTPAVRVFRIEDFPPPEAVAPEAIVTLMVGQDIPLNGAGSRFKNPLAKDEYRWQALLGGTLTFPESSVCLFKANAPGTYFVSLKVSEGAASDAEVVEVSVRSGDSAGIVPLEELRTIAGVPVVLDGRKLVQPGTDSLSCRWNLLTGGGRLSDSAALAPSFMADEPGEYVAILINASGGPSHMATARIVVSDLPPLKANPGENRQGYVDEPIRLDGSASDTGKTGKMEYRWSTVEEASLDSAESARPLFTAGRPGNYPVYLSVRLDARISPEERIHVRLLDLEAPTAMAGRDVTARVGEEVFLDGGMSAGRSGATLQFRWSSPRGGTLGDSSSQRCRFSADKPAIYPLILTVSDGKKQSLPTTVFVTVVDSVSMRVIADAGPDTSTFVAQPVRLNGKGSLSLDGLPLELAWSTPLGGALDTASSPTPQFTADRPGKYMVVLRVKAGKDSSLEDRTIVEVKSYPAPVAVAGRDTTIFIGQTLALDGSGSSTSGPRSRGYRWSSSLPGSLADSLAEKPVFSAREPGDFTVSLVVSDGFQTSEASWIRVRVLPGAPLAANAGKDTAIKAGATLLLEGLPLASGGEAIEYLWRCVPPITPFDSVSRNPVFKPDRSGPYVIGLSVQQGGRISPIDWKVVEVQDTSRGVTLAGDPGKDTAIYIKQALVLDGRGSRASNNRPFEYHWEALNGGRLEMPLTATPRFSSDSGGEFVIKLTVIQDSGISHPAFVVVSVIDTSSSVQLTANAGPDTTTSLGIPVRLDGRGSSVSNGLPFTFAWEPLNGGTLGNTDSSMPFFSSSKPGEYLVSLKLAQGAVTSAADFVKVTVPAAANLPPIADAGNKASFLMVDSVRLDGGNSSDPEGKGLKYIWKQSSNNPSFVQLDSTATQVFQATAPGVYTFILYVKDDVQFSEPSMVNISIIQPTIFVTPMNIPKSFRTISEGLNAAKDGDTVVIDDTLFVENVKCKKSNLLIMGVSQSKTVIDGRGLSSSFTVDSGVSNVTIRNMSFTRGGKDDRPRNIDVAGLLCYFANNVRIEDVSAYSNFGDGIRVFSSRSIFIDNSDMHSNDFSGVKWTSSSGTINGSRITGNGKNNPSISWGVRLEVVDGLSYNATISNNAFFNSGQVQLLINGPWEAIITGNQFTDVEKGITCEGSFVPKLVMAGNVFERVRSGQVSSCPAPLP